MDDNRPDPERILRNLIRDENSGVRGRLKIFFGYAAGVGKTYAMLRAAQAAARRGTDVVCGYIEPHDRPKTLALAEGLERIKPLSISYKGIKLLELDLDGALKRAPQLILIDELAHTNAYGCRHAKRYQDVEELLRAGIDVYTTVNVQHIESLNDMIESITGAPVHERIPDSLFDGADQVELADIEPQELLERLTEGEVYSKQAAKRAMASFFDIKNLTALREIALRRCADRINLISERIRLAEGRDYYTDEHILVCLSSSPTNPKIIRTGARMAKAFRGAFTALFVETSGFAAMSPENKKRLAANTRLAEQLGASVETVSDDDIPAQIAQFARTSGVSKLLIGRSSIKRRFPWSVQPLTERLIEQAPNLDIYIIPERDVPPYNAREPRRDGLLSAADMAASLSLLAAATLIGQLFYHMGFSEANIITVYILSVLATAVVTSKKIYSLASSLLSVLAFNYFFTEPYYSFNAYGEGYPFTFFIMFIAAFITSTLASRLKNSSRQASETARRTRTLLETNRQLQKARDAEEIASIACVQLAKLFRRSLIFYRASDGGIGEPMLFTADGERRHGMEKVERELAVAEWVYKNNKRAGAGTETLSSAARLYLAVRAGENVYGVVGIDMSGGAASSTENSVMLSILGECALALEKEAALREREKAAVLAKNEQLRANLLRAISHDLRTPLTSISGAAGIMLDSGEKMEKDKRREFCQNIYDDSMWLINMVENLLSVTRLEEGTMKLNLSPELMEEVVSEALRHIDRRSEEHTLTVTQGDELLMAKMDARLIVQVIINIVDNAVKYTHLGSHINIDVRKEDGCAAVEISDDGEGISDEAKPRIFEMFYTAGHEASDSRRSLGLGLALCKSIITAHGGTISVRDNSPKGTVFRFTLPAEEIKIDDGETADTRN